jgi:thioesterase domain-containing protein
MTDNNLDPIAAACRVPFVPLRAIGDGRPLFCFPGADGNIRIFQEMATSLREGHPVYGFDMEALLHVDREFTIEQLSSIYLGIIREVQDKGPYYFCGYSFGGLVAYDITMRLIEQGEKVELLALLDAPNPAYLRTISTADTVQFHKTYMIDRLKQYGKLLLRADLRKIRTKASAFIVTRLGRFFIPTLKIWYRVVNKPVPMLFRVNDPTSGFLGAWRSFTPKQSQEGVVLFRTQDRGPEYDLNQSMGWDACVHGGIQIHIIPGGHLDMLIMPSVRVMAQEMSAYLDNRLTNVHSAD